MRILVLSDSHNDYLSLKKAVETHPTAEVVVFLGDGERDLDRIDDALQLKHVIKVKGNCDIASELNENVVQTICTKKFFITHGYVENVKFGIDRLVYKGQSLDADIILYGHTHTPVNKYIDGVYVFNPGSIRDGNYGFIDITDKGEVMCVNAEI
ncbi:MAG: YfcE family phosphodiesterase [Clostridia bacterium]|nr:YfcE family phosphodiesterase [Clostridia bacterium]